MRKNKNMIIESLEDGGAVLLDTEKEEVFILNKTGYMILKSAINNNCEKAKETFFAALGLPQTEEYLNDYSLFLSQLIDNAILAED